VLLTMRSCAWSFLMLLRGDERENEREREEWKWKWKTEEESALTFFVVDFDFFLPL